MPLEYAAAVAVEEHGPVRLGHALLHSRRASRHAGGGEADGLEELSLMPLIVPRELLGMLH